MANEIFPNRTDILLSHISVTPTEELTSGHLTEAMRNMEGFGAFPLKGILESLAHLEASGRIEFTPRASVTDIGQSRLVEVGLSPLN